MKKAIIVASFGTSYQNALKNSIERIETDIQNKFKEYEVFRAFTAHRIIDKIKRTTGVTILTPEQLLQKLYIEGYTDVVIQPLHIIAGEEYDYIKNVVTHFNDKFNSIKLGRPIFYYEGIEDVCNDYTSFVKSIEHVLNKYENVILFGHGTAHPNNATYGCLQSILEDLGYSNVLVGTVESYPSFNTVLNRLRRKNIKKVLLMPLLVVAGDHALNDMASDEEDSWKTLLTNEGIETDVLLKGLGEFESFRQLYINRVHDTINDTYKGIGKTKKGRKHEDTNNFIKL